MSLIISIEALLLSAIIAAPCFSGNGNMECWSLIFIIIGITSQAAQPVMLATTTERQPQTTALAITVVMVAWILKLATTNRMRPSRITLVISPEILAQMETL